MARDYRQGMINTNNPSPGGGANGGSRVWNATRLLDDDDESIFANTSVESITRTQHVGHDGAHKDIEITKNADGSSTQVINKSNISEVEPGIFDSIMSGITGAFPSFADGNGDGLTLLPTQADIEGLEGNLQNKNTNDALEAYYADNPAVGSGIPALTGEELAESIFEQGAGEMSPYQREYESSGATHTMPDGTVMPGATHRDNTLRGEESAESIFEQGAGEMSPYQREYESSEVRAYPKLRYDAEGAVSREDNQVREEIFFRDDIDNMSPYQREYESSGVSGSGELVERGELKAESIFEQGANEMEYAGDGVATGSGDLAPRGEEIAEGLFAEDIKNIADKPAAIAPLQELEEDIKAANGDDSLIAAAGQEFMDGISELADYDPQLVKSMFAMAAAMMMGSSFGDAMATGFGVMEEAAMAEEAETKARTDEVVDMLILNAADINDATFWATLEEFNLSDEQKESIARKWDLSKGISNVKQFKLKQAEVFQKIHDYGKEMTSLFTNKDNVGDVGPKIDTFLTYAGEQLKNQANPAYVFDGKNEDSIRRAIGSYADRYNRYVAMNNEKGNGLLDQLRNGGIEAVWEGERGSYSMTGGTLTSDVTIAPSQETTYLAAKLNLNLTDKSEAEKNQWLGSQRDFWVKNIQGKGVPYDETDDDVVKMGDLNNVAAGEVGYIGWLYQQTKQMDRK